MIWSSLFIVFLVLQFCFYVFGETSVLGTVLFGEISALAIVEKTLRTVLSNETMMTQLRKQSFS